MGLGTLLVGSFMFHPLLFLQQGTQDSLPARRGALSLDTSQRPPRKPNQPKCLLYTSRPRRRQRQGGSQTSTPRLERLLGQQEPRAEAQEVSWAEGVPPRPIPGLLHNSPCPSQGGLCPSACYSVPIYSSFPLHVALLNMISPARKDSLSAPFG